MKRILALTMSFLLFCGCAAPTTPLSESPVITTVTTTTATTTAVTTTASTKATTVGTTKAPSAQEQVRALLTDSHVADIYKDSYKSIFGRIRDTGFMKESLTGMYQGEYIRSIGALAILADKVGEQEAAKKTLKFVTDVMKKKGLAYVPFTISADGNTVRTDDELDGRAHFVLGWALYVLKSNDTAYFEDTYTLMKREADAFCSSNYFYEDLGLVRNRRFTHTRIWNGKDYHDAFDLLTNTFTAQALEKMVAVAKAKGHGEDAVKWEDTLKKLQTGIEKNLTHTVDGKKVYLELIQYNGGQYVKETGMSWVCISPFASGYQQNLTVAQNTAALARKRLWKTTPSGGYLAVECSASGSVKNWILGKSVGWDLTAACKAGDMSHILKTLQFLNTYHTGTVYMEKMQPANSGWKTIDPGNAEQVIWFLYGYATLRQQMGLD